MKIDSMFLANPNREYPALGSFPTGVIYKQQPIPLRPPPREFAIVDIRREPLGRLANVGAVTSWNLLWESGQLRADFFEQAEWPAHREHHPEEPSPDWLMRYRDRNITLLPRSRSMYGAYGPLYQLMPRGHLARFGLPALHSPSWPAGAGGGVDAALPTGFHQRFEQAFAAYIWPYITDEQQRAFESKDPIRLLAANLDYWIGPLYDVIEEVAREAPLIEIEDDLARRTKAFNDSIESENVFWRPARLANLLWSGEDEAVDVTKAMVERADKDGRLRSVIDAIRRRRVVEDFSPYWSREREAFERAFNHSRAKTMVHFIELPDSCHVHSPWHEIDAEIDFSLFEAMLSPKDREIFILLRKGHGPVDIARDLGYANHTPVSKRLKRIRAEAARCLL